MLESEISEFPVSQVISLLIETTSQLILRIVARWINKECRGKRRRTNRRVIVTQAELIDLYTRVISGTESCRALAKRRDRGFYRLVVCVGVGEGTIVKSTGEGFIVRALWMIKKFGEEEEVIYGFLLGKSQNFIPDFSLCI